MRPKNSDLRNKFFFGRLYLFSLQSFQLKPTLSIILILPPRTEREWRIHRRKNSEAREQEIKDEKDALGYERERERRSC